MSKIIAIALAAGAAIVASAPASAAQGCGRDAHYSFHNGQCVWNGRDYRYHPSFDARRGPGPGYGRGDRGYGPPRGPVLVVGTFYPGHGYWDGRRYWQRHERRQGGWRYR